MTTAPFPTLLSGFTRDQETNITIRCHDELFQSVEVIDDSNGEILFTVTSKAAASLSWRRSIRSPSGRKLFDLRHKGYAKKDEWIVEKGTRRLSSLRHTSPMVMNRTDLDVTIRGAGSDPKNTILVRPREGGAFPTAVLWQGVVVALIKNTEVNDAQSTEEEGLLDRTVWKARIHKGVDVSFILTTVLCLAEMEHVWKL